MKRIFKTLLLLMIATICAGPIAGHLRTKAQLEIRLATLQAQHEELKRLRENNQQMRDIVVRADAEGATLAVKDELARVRQVVARLEHARSQTGAIDLSPTQNPEQGFVALADFKNKGRATPGAGFQTVLWAITSGDDETLVRVFALSDAGRERLRAYWSGLPVDVRATISTPEELIAMGLAYDVINDDAYHIVGQTAQGADQVLLRVRRLKHGIPQPDEKKIPMQRATDGWQLMIPDKAIDDLPEALESASLHNGPKPDEGASQH